MQSIAQILYPSVRVPIKPKAFPHSPEWTQLVRDQMTLFEDSAVPDETYAGKVILSINRFERKKRLNIALHAVHYLLSQHHNVFLIMAGGCDQRVRENVEYLAELINLYVSIHRIVCLNFFLAKKKESMITLCPGRKNYESQSEYLSSHHLVMSKGRASSFGAMLYYIRRLMSISESFLWRPWLLEDQWFPGTMAAPRLVAVCTLGASLAPLTSRMHCFNIYKPGNHRKRKDRYAGRC